MSTAHAYSPLFTASADCCPCVRAVQAGRTPPIFSPRPAAQVEALRHQFELAAKVCAGAAAAAAAGTAAAAAPLSSLRPRRVVLLVPAANACGTSAAHALCGPAISDAEDIHPTLSAVACRRRHYGRSLWVILLRPRHCRGGRSRCPRSGPRCAVRFAALCQLRAPTL